MPTRYQGPNTLCCPALPCPVLPFPASQTSNFHITVQQPQVKPCCPALPRPSALQTTKAHITVLGGVVEELVADAGLVVVSTNPFKGDMDCAKLEDCIQRHGADKIAFVRVEAGTNLIGGQPFSLQNLRDVRAVSGCVGVDGCRCRGDGGWGWGTS